MKNIKSSFKKLFSSANLFQSVVLAQMNLAESAGDEVQSDGTGAEVIETVEENGVKNSQENTDAPLKENAEAQGKEKPAACLKKTSVGGQALIEGMLMIGPKNVAIAVRKPDHEIELQVKPLPPKTKLQNIPLLRGVVGMFRQMKVGVSALMYSAEFFDIEEEEANEGADSEKPKEEEKPSKVDAFLERVLGDKLKDVVISVAVVISLLFSIGLFILLPNFVAGFLPFDKAITNQLLLSNLFEGVIRVTIFFLYLQLTSKMEEIKRVWQYHGAEHKTIHCYEHGDELTVQNIQKYTTKHPRCGTSFLFLVMIISILIFSVVDIVMLNLPFKLIGIAKIISGLLIRLITIPLVAGVAYELIKLAGRYDNTVTRVISAPGLFFQRFTTREPDDEMVEVAIVAFKNAMVEDEKEMAW